MQKFNLDIPMLKFYLRQSNFDSNNIGQYLVYNSSTTYLTVLEKIYEFCLNP